MVTERPSFPATKFTVPVPGQHTVKRLRALQRLVDGDGRPVTVVRAFPGSGKTELVADWIASFGADMRADVVWISCDDGDGAHEVLWSALDVALHRCLGLDGAVHPFEAGWTPEGAAATIVNHLIDHDRQVVVVFDDAHRAGAAIATLDPLIERLPDRVRVVFTTRTELPLNLEPLRMRRLVCELEQSDLDLEVAEMASVLAATGAEIDATMHAALHGRIQGWLTPITLVTAGPGGPNGDLERLAGASRSVSGAASAPPWLPPRLEHFFRKSVLTPQREEIKEFLFDVSILDEFTAADCRAILRNARGDQLLREAEACGLFIVRPDGGDLYRFHGLFREFLRREKIGSERDRERELHRRAAAWYGSEGRTRLSVRHHVAAGDVVAALLVIEAEIWHGGAGVSRSNLASWLAELSDDAVRETRSTEAYATYALALVCNDDVVRARRWLVSLEDLPGDTPSTASMDVVLTRMVLAMTDGDVDEAGRCRDELVRLRGGSLAQWPSAVESVVTIETSAWADDHRAANAFYERHVGRSSSTSIDDIVLSSTYSAAAAAAGDLTEGRRLAEWSHQTARELGLGDHPALVRADRALGLIEYEQGHFERAYRILTDLDEQMGDSSSSIALLTRVALARVELAIGHVEEARETVTALSGLLPIGTRSPLRDHAVSIDVRVALALGAIGRARELVDHVQTPWRAAMLNVRVRLAAGELAEAAEAIEKIDPPRTKRAQVDLLVASARVARRMKDPARCEELVREAVALSMPETAVRPFFEDGLELWPTLRKVLASWPRHRFHDAAQRVAVHSRSLRSTASAAAGQADDSPVLASLRPRELEVLRLIGQRLSNREIAAMLYISSNTLKTHTRSLYRKLGVHTRDQAVAAAEQLNLV